jgi:hypothetical protein
MSQILGRRLNGQTPSAFILLTHSTHLFFLVQKLILFKMNRHRFRLLYKNHQAKTLQGDQKIFVRLMITIQKVTSNIQSVLNLTAWQPTTRARGTLDSH